MPGTPRPVVDPRFGPAWTPILQAAQNAKQQTMALNSGAQSINIVDQYGNTLEIAGSNLNQIITRGAAFMQPGVLLGTGFSSGTAGRAAVHTELITTVTLTAGSTAATLGSAALGTLPIGAADVSDPSTGLATPAIVPGTNAIATGSTSITLSHPAAESGSGLYCVLAAWDLFA